MGEDAKARKMLGANRDAPDTHTAIFIHYARFGRYPWSWNDGKRVWDEEEWFLWMESVDMARELLGRYYAFVKSLPCLACGSRNNVEADHLQGFSLRTKLTTPRSHRSWSAFLAVPLCRECHRARHTMKEKTFYASVGWDREKLYMYLASQLAHFLLQEEVRQYESKNRTST